jgi:hypothetical protein
MNKNKCTLGLIILIIANRVASEKCKKLFRVIAKNTCTLDSNEFDPPQHGAQLQLGVCIGKSYEKGIASKSTGTPENTTKDEVQNSRGGTCWETGGCTLPYTLVYTQINHQMVREINDQKRTVTLDMSMTLFWMDTRITTYKPALISVEQAKLGFGLPLDRAKHIWIPDLYIYNLADYNSFKSSLNFVSLEILTMHHLDRGFCFTGPMVRYEIEAKVTFYCDFDYSSYPMDQSTCKLRLGSKRSNMRFKLHDERNANFNGEIYQALDFEVQALIVEERYSKDKMETVGLDIKMNRVLKPFTLKYYLPCITVVIVSQCSFVIPLTALPGRVALIVTQFLTLTTIFLRQMVIFKDSFFNITILDMLI